MCRAENARKYFQDKSRAYYQCRVCSLVFVPSGQFLSDEDEKKRYDLHQNSPRDLNYRRFLSRLFIPLQKKLIPRSHGLDFGSGPEPTLSRMFEEMGYHMALFDRFYEPVPAALERQYDFITATEVVEHLRDPQKELDRLWACLKPGGWLGIMTKFVAQEEEFSQWYYKNDPTHVCFFPGETFVWLAHKWNAEVVFAEGDVALFHKDVLKKNDDKNIPNVIAGPYAGRNLSR